MISEKIQDLADSSLAKPAVVGAVTAIATLPTTALAEGATSVSVSDFQGVLTAMQGQVSVTTIVGVLTAGATAAIGLTFMWWGVRKLTQMLFSAFRKGRTNP